MSNHLIKQGNTYHVKVAIPADVQDILGKKAFKKSLKTADKTVAIARSGPLIIEYKKKIEEARGNPTQSLDQFLEDAREVLREARKDPHVNEDDLFPLQQEIIEKLAKAFGARHPEELNPKDEQQVIRAYKVADGQLTPLEQHLEDYLGTRAIESKTLDRNRQAIKRFAESCTTVQDVNKQAVRDFVKRLSDPKPEGMGLQNHTIKVHLSALMGYWRYLCEEGIAPEDAANPFEKVRLPEVSRKDANEAKRLEFTVSDIQMLHQAISEKGDEQLAAIFDLAIYTGARIDELAQLQIKNVSIDEITIKRAKSKAGNRTLPVHDELKPLVAALLADAGRTEGSKYLIPGLPINQYGNRSDALSKRFGRLKFGLGFDDRYVFHSIRMTVSTIFEQNDVPENVTADILGHDKNTMSYGVYSGGSSMEQKRAAIMKLDYRLN